MTELACRTLVAGVVASLGACQASPDDHPDAAPPATEPAPRADIQRKGDPIDDQCLVDFLDVGTGLAVFIRCKPAGKPVVRILYDGGTNDSDLNKQGRLAYI